ncbi:MAG: ATP-binding protein [Bacteroidota bacterium]
MEATMIDVLPRKILLVDDDPITLKIVGKKIESFGFTVSTASTGEEAVSLVQQGIRTDLVVMDIYLGSGMDGTEAARQIAAITNIPVLFFSAYSDKETVAKVRGLKRYGYVVKSSDEFVLHSSIEMAFELHDAHERLKEELQRRERSEESLRESEEKYRLIAENTSDGIMIFNADGRLTYSSEGSQKQLGYVQSDAVDLNAESIYSMIHPDDRDMVFGNIFEAIKEKKQGLVYTYRVKHAAGHYIWREDNASFKYTADGTYTGSYVICRDITERKTAQQELMKLNTELEQRVIQRTKDLLDANHDLESFNYSVSHDLRAPVRAIDGFTSMLMEQYENVFDDEAKRLMMTIRKSTKKIDQLINGLLSLSRVGKQELKYERVNMELIAQSILQEEIQKMRGGKFTYTVGTLPHIHCDLVLVRQVWFNLISNAVKYSSKAEHPHIEIDARDDGDAVTFSVKDNGAGFNPKYTNKLFGIFQRLHVNNEFEGIGIGLSTVKRIVQRLGGMVYAEGEENKGATFRFTLPKDQSSGT